MGRPSGVAMRGRPAWACSYNTTTAMATPTTAATVDHRMDPVSPGHRAPATQPSANSLLRSGAPYWLFGVDTPRTHHDYALTCEYVMGTNVVGVRSDWFPQIMPIGVQVGFRSRSGNASRKNRVQSGRSVTAAVRGLGGAGLPGSHQGSGNQYPPEQEPGIPQVSVPGKRPAVGAGRRRNHS